MTQTVSETLYRAADLIESRGWTKGGGGDAEPEDFDPWGKGGDSPVCLEGAIFAAAGGDEWWQVSMVVNACPAGQAVRDYLGMDSYSGPSSARLYRFNDQRGRTAAEVIEVLRAAALIEAAKEAPHEPAANASRTEAVSA